MRLHRIVALICLCAGAVLAQSAPASTGTGQKVGVIDLHSAILSTQQGKQQVVAIRTRFDPRQAKLKQGGAELQTLQDKLQKGATLTPEQKASLQQQIATREHDLERDAQETQTDFNQARDQMELQLSQKMMAVLRQYAASHGFSVVLDISQPWPNDPVLYAADATNLGEIAIRLFDSKYPAQASQK